MCDAYKYINFAVDFVEFNGIRGPHLLSKMGTSRVRYPLLLTNKELAKVRNLGIHLRHSKYRKWAVLGAGGFVLRLCRMLDTWLCLIPTVRHVRIKFFIDCPESEVPPFYINTAENGLEFSYENMQANIAAALLTSMEKLKARKEKYGEAVWQVPEISFVKKTLLTEK